MKFIISVHDTRIKNKTSKAKLKGQKELSGVILKFLSKNPHFKSVKEVSLNVTLCGKVKIKTLNSEYRSLNKVTDVLSFGVHENLRTDHKVKLFLPPTVELGDIFICKEIARRQAHEFEITFDQEILHLLTHGFLHLLGFDHEISAKEEKIMELLEDQLIKQIYRKLGYSA